MRMKNNLHEKKIVLGNRSTSWMNNGLMILKQSESEQNRLLLDGKKQKM